MSSKQIFITGVSSGIGLGLAKEYLKHGHQVFGVSRRQPEIMGADGFKYCSVDLTDTDSVDQALSQLFNSIDKIDVAILNAGVLGEVADMRDATLEDLRSTMEINVWSNKTLIDGLVAQINSVEQIVTISSGAAVNGNRGWNGYSISKAALNMLTKLYATELPDIHFSAIAPGLVDTAMQDYLCNFPADHRFDSLEQLKSRRGTDEMPSPEEIAPKLVELFDLVKNNSPSGEFVDIRTVSIESMCDARR